MIQKNLKIILCEIYHGILIFEKREDLKEKASLFKFFYFDEKLYFALFDNKSIFYSIIPREDVLKINKDLNPSLEFNDVFSLINFLKENLIVKNKSLAIRYKEKYYD